MTRSIFIALAALLPLGSALAQDRPHHQPPQQAFDACKSKAAGDACSVTFHDRTIDGTCKAPHDATDGALACHPAHHGPPPEAFDACKSKAAGDACSVTFGDRSFDGTCGSHHGGELACHPAHHGPQD